MMGSKKSILIAIVVLLLAVIAVAWWYMRRAPEPLPENTAGNEGGLGAQIFEGAQNPLKNDVPETNPFAADANPFDADTNPYKDTYKNPF